MYVAHLTLMSLPHAAPELNVEFAEPAPTHSGVRLLDNPILNSLLGDHRAFAMGEGAARRYAPAIGPLAGVPVQSSANYASLKALVEPAGILVLFFSDPPALPSGWSLFRGDILTQMICRNPRFGIGDRSRSINQPRQLDVADVPAMIELAKLTEPGPFRERTIELGGFYGIFEGDRLVAMAGQRMRVPGFAEVSAVCTHPEARGRGYAGILMQQVMREIIAEGRTPFLHALAENPAVRLYQQLGFEHRRSFHLAVIRNER